MSGLAISVPPIVAIIFLGVFARSLWWQQEKSTEDKGEDTGPHSERVYKSFEFFVTASLAVVGGLGYIRLEYFGEKTEIAARQAMFGLGLLELTIATFISLFIVIHQGSKIRRWEKVEREKIPFWLELWMCIAIMTVGTMIWLASNLW